MQGCLGKIEDKVTYYAPILIGIGIGVAMLQVIFFCFIIMFFVLFFHAYAFCCMLSLRAESLAVAYSKTPRNKFYCAKRMRRSGITSIIDVGSRHAMWIAYTHNTIRYDTIVCI